MSCQLSDTAVKIIQTASLCSGRPLIFGHGQRRFRGWSKAKAALDLWIATTCTAVRPWRLHDVRRTAATRLADLGTLPRVIEAVLNHVSGHKAGAAGIYNRALSARERRKALSVWAANGSRLTEASRSRDATASTLADGISFKS